MAFSRRSSNTAFRISKIALFSVGMVAAAVFARFAVPYCIGILSAAVPRLWLSFRGWLVPPYLFITVHLIILTIWKLSDQKLHKDRTLEDPKSSEDAVRDVALDEAKTSDPVDSAKATDLETVKPLPPVSDEILVESDAETHVLVEKSGDESSPESARSCVTTDSDENSAISLRFEEGKSEDENGTMEDAWKAIVEGSAIPVLKKSETWERSRRSEADHAPPPAAAIGGGRGMAKSETFKERGEIGHEEWNRRFEEFIKKNYDQIRLQTEESSRRRVEIVHRETY